MAAGVGNNSNNTDNISRFEKNGNNSYSIDNNLQYVTKAIDSKVEVGRFNNKVMKRFRLGNEFGSQTNNFIFSAGFEDPTYLTFKIEFGDWGNSIQELEQVRSQQRTRKTANVYASNYDEFPMGLLNIDYMSNFNRNSWNSQTQYNAYNYLMNRNEDTRAQYIKTFAEGLYILQKDMPYIFQKISGLDKLLEFNTSAGARLKDAKITIECLEGLDLKITTLLQAYRKAAYDDIWQRWILPDIYRYFKMIIYVFDRRYLQTGQHALYSPEQDEFPIYAFECGPCEFDIESILNSEYSVNYGEHSAATAKLSISVKNVKTYYSNALFNKLEPYMTNWFSDLESRDEKQNAGSANIYNMLDITKGGNGYNNATKGASNYRMLWMQRQFLNYDEYISFHDQNRVHKFASGTDNETLYKSKAVQEGRQVQSAQTTNTWHYALVSESIYSITNWNSFKKYLKNLVTSHRKIIRDSRTTDKDVYVNDLIKPDERSYYYYPIFNPVGFDYRKIQSQLSAAIKVMINRMLNSTYIVDNATYFKLHDPGMEFNLDKVVMEYITPIFNEAKTDQELVQPIFDLNKPEEQVMVKPELNIDHIEHEMVKPELNIDHVEHEMVKPELNINHVEQEMVKPEFNLDHVEQEMVKPELNLNKPKQKYVNPILNLDKPEMDMVEPEFNLNKIKQELISPEFKLYKPEMDMVEPEFNLDKPEMEMTKLQYRLSKTKQDMVEPIFNLNKPEMDMVEPEFNLDKIKQDLISPEFNLDKIKQNLISPEFNLDKIKQELISPELNLDKPEMDMVEPISNTDHNQMNMVEPIINDGHQGDMNMINPIITDEHQGEMNMVNIISNTDHNQMNLINPIITDNHQGDMNMVEPIINDEHQGDMNMINIVSNTDHNQMNMVEPIIDTDKSEMNFVELSIDTSIPKMHLIEPIIDIHKEQHNMVEPIINADHQPFSQMTAPIMNVEKPVIDMIPLEQNVSKSEMDMVQVQINDSKSEMDMTNNIHNPEKPVIDMIPLEQNISKSEMDMTQLDTSTHKVNMDMVVPTMNISKSEMDMIQLDISTHKVSMDMTSNIHNSEKTEMNMVTPSINVSKSEMDMVQVQINDSKSEMDMIKIDVSTDKPIMNMTELEQNLSKIDVSLTELNDYHYDVSMSYVQPHMNYHKNNMSEFVKPEIKEYNQEMRLTENIELNKQYDVKMDMTSNIHNPEKANMDMIVPIINDDKLEKKIHMLTSLSESEITHADIEQLISLADIINDTVKQVKEKQMDMVANKPNIPPHVHMQMTSIKQPPRGTFMTDHLINEIDDAALERALNNKNEYNKDRDSDSNSYTSRNRKGTAL